MMASLDQEEQAVLESFEAGEWRSVPQKEQEIERYRENARTTLRKDRRVNIRISSQDLTALKKRALAEGIPYQTLISSILHKYISGRLEEQPV